jgi:hypothetical protein
MAAYFVVNDTTLFNRPGNYTTSRDATQARIPSLKHLGALPHYADVFKRGPHRGTRAGYPGPP